MVGMGHALQEIKKYKLRVGGGDCESFRVFLVAFHFIVSLHTLFLGSSDRKFMVFGYY